MARYQFSISFGLVSDLLLSATALVPLSGGARWNRRRMSRRGPRLTSRFCLRLHARLLLRNLLVALVKMIGGNFKLGKGGNDQERGRQEKKSNKSAPCESRHKLLLSR